MTGVDCEALRALLEKARHWKCTRDRMRCMDSNGCECEMAGDPDPLPELERLAIHALPALLAKSAAYDALVAERDELVASWENCYEMCGSIAYRNCTDELERLLVSDDRPSHTAGEK